MNDGEVEFAATWRMHELVCTLYTISEWTYDLIGRSVRTHVS